MSGSVVKSHIWRQSVFYIATAGLMKNIFKSRRSAKWRLSQKSKHIYQKKGQRSDSGKPLTRPARVVSGVHKISMIQKCLLSDTFPMIQFRNVLRKWHQRSTVFFYSLSERPKLRSPLAKQNDKGSLQEAQWWFSTLDRNFSWLYNSRSQSPQRGTWLSKQSPMLDHNTNFCHSIGSILSVENENFSGNSKESTKIPRVVGKAKSHLHWHVVGIWQLLWRFDMK